MRKKNNSKTVKQAVKPVEIKKEETNKKEPKNWLKIIVLEIVEFFLSWK